MRRAGAAANTASLLVGAAAALVSGISAIRFVHPLLLLDPDPAWRGPRLLLGLAVIGATAACAGLAAAAASFLGRTRVAVVSPRPFPWRRRTLIALAAGIVLAAAAARFVRLDSVPRALWIEDLTLIEPSLALRGKPSDFADAIRPAPSGVARPYGTVGVLYLEAFRAVLVCLGRDAFAVRFLSALAGVLSCCTAMALARALLPRGGGTLAGLAVAGMRWSLILSRWGYVAVVVAPMLDVAALLLLRGRRRGSLTLAAAAGIVLGIGAHVYLAAWIGFAALILFAMWPREDRAPWRARAPVAVWLAAGFAVAAAPLFLLREGRTVPYFARAANQSLWREVRAARSPLPVLEAAADALAAPWWRADPSPWQDVPRPRLGWLLGVPVAIAVFRALRSPRQELSGLLLAHAAAAGAASVASGSVMQPNGFRFAYLTTVTGVAAASGVMALFAASPPRSRRAAALALTGALAVSGALALRTVFFEWAPRLEILDGFSGHDNLAARTALAWEGLGSVEIAPPLVVSATAVDLVRSVRRADRSPAARGTVSLRQFRIVAAGTGPAPGERIVERVADENGRAWAVVIGRAAPPREEGRGER
ncbi:MAG: hypothetical protein ABI592_15495 [Acidobacteriota bacterium]